MLEWQLPHDQAETFNRLPQQDRAVDFRNHRSLIALTDGG